MTMAAHRSMNAGANTKISGDLRKNKRAQGMETQPGNWAIRHPISSFDQAAEIPCRGPRSSSLADVVSLGRWAVSGLRSDGEFRAVDIDGHRPRPVIRLFAVGTTPGNPRPDQRTHSHVARE